MSQHNCPIAGCPQMVRRDLLMCRPHWAQVPARLQREVYAAYTARLNDEDGAILRHMRACEHAEAAVEGREPDLAGLE